MMDADSKIVDSNDEARRRKWIRSFNGFVGNDGFEVLMDSWKMMDSKF